MYVLAIAVKTFQSIVRISASGARSKKLLDMEGSGLAYVPVMAVTRVVNSEERTMRLESLRQILHPWRG